MKKLRLLFGVCLGALVFSASWATDQDDVVRAASRRDTSNSNTTSSTRTAPVSTSAKKIISATARGATTPTRISATESRTNTNKSVVGRTSTAPQTITRNQSNVVPRTNTQTATRNATNSSSRTTTGPRVARTATTRTATSRGTTTNRTERTTARAATMDESGKLVTNYTRCREIYYECMDEFCANKDANLRRCACSSRATEFNRTQKQLTNFEDKMLDFNQRLLLVNMDAEDVASITKSTEGEDAFYGTKDRTKSKRTLDAISKKLNDSFNSDSSGGFSLAPISLSLNADAAFDSIDSLGGIDTTTKSGTALYSAAMPVCHEVALEVCTEDELSLAASGYQMMIEQDCNTVFKSYQSQVDQARTKVFESGALLDMSRLDAYQTRNSDDMLTCKRKMLEMLTDTTVCGSKLEKCLDMTGKYIDPTTGTAFLTNNLADLADLITRPAANQTWTSANANGKFIPYLQNRKHYLEPAMENCQTIADSVWDAFIEDALSQIKLAQIAKLEEIRQACTTLTSECLDSAIDSINEFDARSLSIFGVAANRTANAMCADVKNACVALIDSTGDTLWKTGVSDIMTNQTYETIVSSCTQVGQNCIIQACKSISGNFDLCNDIDTSPNRHAILERTACWPEVLACVGAAGDDALLSIASLLNLRPNQYNHNYSFYKQMYDLINPSPIEDICADTCTSPITAECAKCRIAESIWGNCETRPTDTIKTNNIAHNRIYEPASDVTTLLYWFAQNTGKANDNRSCVNTRCTSDVYYPGEHGPSNPICVPEGTENSNITSDGLYCPTPHTRMTIFTNPTGQQPATNCCFSNSNYWHHELIGNNACCEGAMKDNICLPNENTEHKIVLKHEHGTPNNPGDDYYLVCVGTNQVSTDVPSNPNFPAGQALRCVQTSGARFVLITPDNRYITPNDTTTTPYTPQMVYYGHPNDNQTSHDAATEQPVNNSGAESWYIKYSN